MKKIEKEEVHINYILYFSICRHTKSFPTSGRFVLRRSRPQDVSLVHRQSRHWVSTLKLFHAKDMHGHTVEFLYCHTVIPPCYGHKHRTLYCAKGNYEFGISRIMKSLEPYAKKVMRTHSQISTHLQYTYIVFLLQ